MRVNIYGEEITSKITIERKAVDQRLFVAVRFYLKSHPALHHSESDNDESAVTFWCPWTKARFNDTGMLARMFRKAAELIEAEDPTKRK